jgi:hypothetical protein
MGLLLRESFQRGWVPSADAVHAPADGLLRADNCVLDERGVLALRRGSSRINGSPFSDTDVHSLYTASLSGTRYRMAGANNAVYANGASISSGLAGSGDITFGSYLDQILFARSTSKKKYDGSTVRNWGISMTGGVPTVAVTTADKKTFISGDSTESPAVVIDVSDGTAIAYQAGYDGTANGAVQINPSTDTGGLVIHKTFGSDQDFSVLDASTVATDDDVLSVWVYLTNPAAVRSVLVKIATNSSLSNIFQTDYFQYQWFIPGDPAEPLPWSLVPGTWSQLTVRRGAMFHQSLTPGKGWATVRGVQLVVECDAGGAANLVAIDELRISGGALTGDTTTWKYVYVRNTGAYSARSAPSSASAETVLRSQSAVVTAPSDGSRDSQVNEIWLYRFIAEAGDYYRVKVQTGVSGTGSVAITDALSDADALTVNLVLNATLTTPPDSIIGIGLPHYDRVLVLTATYLWPSLQLNLDSFDSDHAVRVGDASETALWILVVREDVYVGTTKDIYRIEGDWTERADGTLNIIKRNLGVSHPPISGAVALEGDSVIYLAADGWRGLGSDRPITSGDVDLLYRGYTRHGVSPVNITGGRFKGAVASGLFTAITPEGSSTTSSSVLHRYSSSLQRWYRHAYGTSWRSLYREPDGTLIAGDSSGYVWILDTGTQDNGSNIAIVVWTGIDANGQPVQRKRAGDFRIRLDTGGATAIVAVHMNGSNSAAQSVSAASSGIGVVNDALDDLALALQFQLRVTGSFSTFKWYDAALSYVECPAPMQGQTPEDDGGFPGPKAISALRVRLCTLGVARSITPLLDGVAQSAVSVTTGTDEPDDVLIPLSAAVATTDVAFSVDGPIELYRWAPVVEHRLPPPRRLYDSGPLDLGSRAAWVPSLEIKALLADDLTVTPYVDGIAQPAQTVTARTTTMTYSVSLPRVIRGRQLRVVLASDAEFHLYWVDWNYRLTGGKSDLKRTRHEVAAA